MERNEILAAILRKQPKIHCLTNPVTMNDVANILLAAGGSAVMAQDEQEAAEITTFCQEPFSTPVSLMKPRSGRASLPGNVPISLVILLFSIRSVWAEVLFAGENSGSFWIMCIRLWSAAIRKKRLYSVLFIRNRKHIFPTAAWKAACIWMRRT